MNFSSKINKTDPPLLYFNQNLVKLSSTLKHLQIAWGTKLNISLPLKNVKNKVNKTIGLLHKLQNALTRTLLITNFKSFTWPQLDYGGKIYDGAYNTSLHQDIESIQ